MKKITEKISLKLLLIMAVALSACSGKDNHTDEAKTVKDENIEATGPYLTRDNNGVPVLCWTAKDASDSLYRLKYAVFDTAKHAFGTPISVSPTVGMSHSPESMAKVAFKADGSVIAVYARKFESKTNRFAGGIFYTSSADGGKTWQQQQFIHSDTSHDFGRNFFDLAVLKNGEVAAIWLDGRFAKTEKGDALFFARTSPGKGFGKDSCLNKSTCECCRTNLISDANGNLYAVYRSIQYPTSLIGAQVRDMVYIVSKDNGKTFSREKAISNDNWKIEACPHTGPSLALYNSKLNAVWFTAAAGDAGIFHASLNGETFGKRQLVTAGGKHPQLCSVGNKLVMVCEEPVEAKKEEHQHSMSGMSHSHEPAAAAKISLVHFSGNTKPKATDLTDGAFADHHAVVTALGEKALIAWIREEGGKSSICYILKNLDHEN